MCSIEWLCLPTDECVINHRCVIVFDAQKNNRNFCGRRTSHSVAKKTFIFDTGVHVRATFVYKDRR